MINRIATTAFVALLPFAAHAGGFDTAADPVAMAPAPVMASSPDLIFRLGAGLSYGPAYFGAKNGKAGASGSFSFQFLRGPGGLTLGSETGEAKSGFAPRGSFRVISKRSSKDNAELSGLVDVPLSVEIGFGLGYTSQNFEAFADVRYGAIGHHAFVGELGADVVLRPSDRLTLKVGPRLLAGSSKFNTTYFGVTAAEAAAAPVGSTLTAYGLGGGAVSAGIAMGATYEMTDTWNLDGTLRFDRFVGSAKNSPIVKQGSRDQLTLNIGVSRLISLDF